MTTPPMLKFIKELKLTQATASAMTGFCLRMIGYHSNGQRKLRKLELYGLQYLWECALYKTQPKEFGSDAGLKPRKKKK